MLNFIIISILTKFERFIPYRYAEIISTRKTYVNINGKSFYAPILENGFPLIEKLTSRLIDIRKRTDGKVALDIGSNIGLYSSALIMAGFDHVHSFEPNKEIEKNLIFNLSNFDKDRYTIHDFGIATVSQNLKLSAPKYASELSKKKFDIYASGTKSIYGSGINSIECKFRKFDDIKILLNLKDCDLIKIDVEGAEYDVINSLIPLIKKFKPLIIVELNPNYKDQNAIIFDVLISLGYKSIERVKDKKMFNINDTKDFHDGKDYLFST